MNSAKSRSRHKNIGSQLVKRRMRCDASIITSKMAFIGLCLLLSSWTQTAFAQITDVVHPCKDGDNLIWYFAVGKEVFERTAPFDTPYSFGTTVTDLIPSALLHPPNPKAPVGCKDNPQQLKAYSTSGWPIFGRYNYPERDFPGEMGDGPSQLTIYVVTSPASKQKIPINQIFYPWPLCDRLPFRKVFTDGTVYCTNTLAGLTNPEDSSSIYDLLVSSTAYPLPVFPMRQRLRVQNEFDGEDVGYFLTEEIGITYHTQYGGAPLTSLEKKVIDFDRAVRDSLESAQIQNYSWPQKQSFP